MQTLLQWSIPLPAFLIQLEEAVSQAWLDGAKSVVDWRINDEADRLPLWIITFWREAEQLNGIQSMWKQSMKWLSYEEAWGQRNGKLAVPSGPVQNYGTHISSAEISADIEYSDARERQTMHIQEDAYWRRQADNFDRQLSEVEEEIRRLQRKSSNGPNQNATPASWTSLVPKAQAPTSYAQTAATRPAAQQDVDMTGPEEANYPPLPPPAPPMVTPSNLPTIPRGAQWTPAPPPRLNPRSTRRIIMPTNEEELTELIRRAHEDKNMGAVLAMRIFAWDAHTVGASRSPLQSLALTRWRLPNWVPPDQRSPWATTRPADPSRMEMPRQDAPVEEWARWLWRYPQNLLSKPGITHDPSEAIYWLRGECPVVKATNKEGPFSSCEQLSLHLCQGISIDEVVDAHVWVERQLRHYSQDDNVARRAEAHHVLQRTCQYASTEAQDELRVMVPAWWEAPTPPQPMARPVVIPLSMVTTNASRPRCGSALSSSSLRPSTMDYYPATEDPVAPFPSVAGPGPTGFADGGWMGHVCPPKKKKRNLAYYGITLRPTEGEVLNDLPPVPTDSDESSEDDFTKEVSVESEPVGAQSVPEEKPASSVVTPTDAPMEE
ncbi:hypothetical protein L208DRAFT_1379662 [Tricholoma matsutake]|nr:hypothetical protein L208DRAFT_1379662 [Tricholoma matsutake 945]